MLAQVRQRVTDEDFGFRRRRYDATLARPTRNFFMAPDPSDKDNPSFIQSATPRTVLFANSSISGKLSYNLPVKIDGNFTGEIKSTELLVIGANARVDAHISARQVRLEGKLVGSVQAMGCLEILTGGSFQGEARVGELKIHPGAVFDGQGKVLGPP
jgi:cytoskeletal protein CcmA (bactofilin family)